MDTGLQGKVAIITGGSSGIGKAIATVFAKEGARLAICARDEYKLKQTADFIQLATRADIIAVKANVTKLNDIRRFVSMVIKRFGRIDILVNNAGNVCVGGILNMTDEAWEKCIQLKLLGYIRMAREVIPYMKKNGGGKIINIASITSQIPNPILMASGVINSAIQNFTKSLSRELVADNIIVNCVNPTITNTPHINMLLKEMEINSGKSPEKLSKIVLNDTPCKHFLEPEDVANVVVLLASDTANSLNGICVNVSDSKHLGI